MDQIVLDELISKYNTSEKAVIANKYPFPRPFHGEGEIKAIVLGADPTHITEKGVTDLDVVFGLSQPDKSPYWRQIQRNLKSLKTISINNLYVQNICRNYFLKETGKHKNDWTDIAREFWLPLLKKELDDLFDPKIPVLMTTEFLLKVILKENVNTKKAEKIYKDGSYFSKEQNYLNRDLYAFYRHPAYSLDKWPKYGDFLSDRLSIDSESDKSV